MGHIMRDPGESQLAGMPMPRARARMAYYYDGVVAARGNSGAASIIESCREGVSTERWDCRKFFVLSVYLYIPMRLSPRSFYFILFALFCNGDGGVLLPTSLFGQTRLSIDSSTL